MTKRLAPLWGGQIGFAFVEIHGQGDSDRVFAKRSLPGKRTSASGLEFLSFPPKSDFVNGCPLHLRGQCAANPLHGKDARHFPVLLAAFVRPAAGALAQLFRAQRFLPPILLHLSHNHGKWVVGLPAGRRHFRAPVARRTKLVIPHLIFSRINHGLNGAFQPQQFARVQMEFKKAFLHGRTVPFQRFEQSRAAAVV